MQGSQCFRLKVVTPEAMANFFPPATTPTPYIGSIPEEYRDFADVFQKSGPVSG